MTDWVSMRSEGGVIDFRGCVSGGVGVCEVGTGAVGGGCVFRAGAGAAGALEAGGVRPNVTGPVWAPKIEDVEGLNA